eukprot:maker-scaffold927_size80360-snap-gene-0.22 protein:Tk12211 transcript:maker-scaffold927_size80360-snap-gene-0.22-mRNA-1 annotation:"atp-binding cassette"
MAATFFQGQIIYTPSTPFTDSLIQEMNASYYGPLESFQSSLNAYLSLGDRIQEVANMTDQAVVLDLLIHSPVFQALLTNIRPQLDLSSLTDLNLPEVVRTLSEQKVVWESFQFVQHAADCYHLDRFVPSESEDDLQDLATSLKSNLSFSAGLVFLDQDLDSRGWESEHVKYKIRLGKDSVPATYELKPKLWVPGPDDSYLTDLQYLRGFVQVQDMVDRAFMRLTADRLNASQDLSEVGVYTQQFPYPCFERDNYLSGIYTVQLLQISLFLGFSVTLASAVRFQVWEKESQNQQIMEVMGMRQSAVWIVWLLISGLTLIVANLLLTLLLKFGGLIPRSNPFLLFCLLFCYTLSLLAYW